MISLYGMRGSSGSKSKSNILHILHIQPLWNLKPVALYFHSTALTVTLTREKWLGSHTCEDSGISVG